ncbi:MAG: glycosyltransferase family 4 protein [Burkholderiales bacterium]
MKIVVVTDAWSPQVNGVVTTLGRIKKGLEERGHTTYFLTPADFTSIPCPTYPEIRLSLLPFRRIAKRIEQFSPNAIHIATEGPLGMAARKYCVRNRIAFTTAYHTRFPEYVHARIRLPVGVSYRWLRHFHQPAHKVMVPTPAIREGLIGRGFENTVVWTRGVDTKNFCPGESQLPDAKRPVFLYVGRVAVEKNIEAFLKLDLPGSKWVVGDGPQRAKLASVYPDVHFAGMKTVDELPAYYRAADVFVFPSLTDTFGLVLLEALACGTPVAAFPVSGPIDVIGTAPVGVLDNDLRRACMAALGIPRDAARRYAETFAWETSVQQFESYLAPAM